jgi:hypothetical protein
LALTVEVQIDELLTNAYVPAASLPCASRKYSASLVDLNDLANLKHPSLVHYTTISSSISNHAQYRTATQLCTVFVCHCHSHCDLTIDIQPQSPPSRQVHKSPRMTSPFCTGAHLSSKYMATRQQMERDKPSPSAGRRIIMWISRLIWLRRMKLSPDESSYNISTGR